MLVLSFAYMFDRLRVCLTIILPRNVRLEVILMQFKSEKKLKTYDVREETNVWTTAQTIKQLNAKMFDEDIGSFAPCFTER